MPVEIHMSTGFCYPVDSTWEEVHETLKEAQFQANITGEEMHYVTFTFEGKPRALNLWEISGYVEIDNEDSNQK